MHTMFSLFSEERKKNVKILMKYEVVCVALPNMLEISFHWRGYLVVYSAALLEGSKKTAIFQSG